MADNEKKKKEEKALKEGELAPPTRITDWPDEPLNVSLPGNSLDVTLHGTPTESNAVQGFWEYLRQSSEAITFTRYNQFIEDVLCAGDGTAPALAGAIGRFHDATKHRLGGVDTYELLRVATEAFLLLKCGTIVGFRFGRQSSRPRPIGATSCPISNRVAMLPGRS